MRTAILSIVMTLGWMPACGGDGKIDADNTKKNARDRDSGAVTPMDQGNSAADLEMTQKIRQAIVAAESLSGNARNIKIITRGGAVTLRGPVADEAEKARVVALVKGVTGQAPVDVQIEAEAK